MFLNNFLPYAMTGMNSLANHLEFTFAFLCVDVAQERLLSSLVRLISQERKVSWRRVLIDNEMGAAAAQDQSVDMIFCTSEYWLQNGRFGRPAGFALVLTGQRLDTQEQLHVSIPVELQQFKEVMLRALETIKQRPC
jgi:hypothetical protein